MSDAELILWVIGAAIVWAWLRRSPTFRWALFGFALAWLRRGRRRRR